MSPFKSVAVTPINRGRSCKATPSTITPSSGSELAIEAALARPRRPATASPVHRYSVGEELSMIGGGRGVKRAASGCKVIALLPYEGHGALLYRVRSDAEAYERIVAEGDLAS